MARKNLREASGFWIALAAVPLAVAAITITIATTEYHPPWKSVWFIVGVVAGVLGCALALWSLVLYLAHNQADKLACPDPAAHAAAPAPSKRALAAALVAQGRSKRVAWLRPLFREIAGDLRQATEGVQKLQEAGSYDSVTSEFNPSDAWTRERERLAADQSLGDLYDACRDAYGHIERIRLTALGRHPGTPRQSELHQAQLAIEKAQTAIQQSLSELDQEPAKH